MIFGSAERVFLAENYDRALVSLQSYLDKYPDGRYGYKADFYMAESYKSLGKFEQACDSYRKVIEGGEGSFVELSMLNFSNISYKLEKWDDAYGGYSSLFSSALLENNKFVAKKVVTRYKDEFLEIHTCEINKVSVCKKRIEFVCCFDNFLA